jgi:hypothetical protein
MAAWVTSGGQGCRVGRRGRLVEHGPGRSGGVKRFDVGCGSLIPDELNGIAQDPEDVSLAYAVIRVEVQGRARFLPCEAGTQT